MTDVALTHPRPSLRRDWTSLDGTWEFAVADAAHRPADVDFATEICVPFAPETIASGIGHGAVECCWYRRIVDVDSIPGSGRAVMHFGGVDRVADVWIDGAHAGHHVGGYASFSVALPHSGPAEVIVRAVDPAGDLAVPRGKQDWADEPHGIWYPRTTGIWKSVWAERVPDSSITDVEWIPDVASMTVTLRADLAGVRPGDRLAVRLRVGERTLIDDDIGVTDDHVERRFPIGDGGFDDRHGLLWWPSRPTMIDAELRLVRDGEVVDTVESATALRSADVRAGRFRLNGRPFQLRMVLDQGYWPASGATPPTLDALRRDIELTRELGFNAVRKHQKTEDPRYFALADRIGLMAWVEMPSAYRSGRRASASLLREWSEIVAAHRNHPSVVGWVPINESWGVEQCERDASQRATITALREMTNALDGTRPVSANDGWETIGGDIVGIHDYDQDPVALERRWGSHAAIHEQLTGRRPDGRRSDLDGEPAGGRAVVLSEFGGTALDDDTGAETFGTDNWGYDGVATPDDLLERYRALWAVVHRSDGLAGACWTQLTDTYQEVNGLLRADRSPKVDVAAVRRATTGRGSPTSTAPGQPTTEPPTTEPPTTEQPTTEQPTTEQPTTEPATIRATDIAEERP